MSDKSVQITLESLRRFVPFNSLSEMHLKDIAQRAKALRFPSGKMVFKRGDVSKQCYYLLSGSIDLCDQDFNITKVNSEDDKAKFALDNQSPHNVSAVSTDDVMVLAIDKDHLDLVLTWDQAGNYLVTDLAQDETLESDWMSALLQSSLFAQVPPANIQQLFATFQQENVSTGELVIEQGEEGDRFYVIERGTAEVTRRAGDGEELLANLTPGKFFGEEALVGNTARNASVRMTSNGSLMYLEKDQFTELLHEPVLEFATQQDLDESLENGDNIKILDVRMENEFQNEATPNAINIPLSDLRDHLNSLEPDAIYVVVCDGGRRSEAGAYLLTEAGLRAVVLRG